MKKKIYAILIVFVMFSGCKEDCENCEQVRHEQYYIDNTSDIDVLVTWYGNTARSTNVFVSFNVYAQRNVILYRSSDDGVIGLLDAPPFPGAEAYDSLVIKFATGDKLVYFPDSCDSSNPLCEQGYEYSEALNEDKQFLDEWRYIIM